MSNFYISQSFREIPSKNNIQMKPMDPLDQGKVLDFFKIVLSVMCFLIVMSDLFQWK